MVRRILRLGLAVAVTAGSAVVFASPHASAVIDADEVNGAAAGSTCTAGESCAAGGAAAPAINVESSDTVFVEDNINVATLNEGDVTSNEGDTNTVDCRPSNTDNRSADLSIGGSLPNQSAAGVGVSSRCVNNAGTAFLGDTNTETTTNLSDDDVTTTTSTSFSDDDLTFIDESIENGDGTICLIEIGDVTTPQGDIIQVPINFCGNTVVPFPEI